MSASMDHYSCRINYLPTKQLMDRSARPNKQTYQQHNLYEPKLNSPIITAWYWKSIGLS